MLLEAPAGPWVKYHNIVGQAPREGFTSTASMWLSGDGDGVVSLASARLDGVASQIVVPADHAMVHRHPQAILEVRRILREHLAQLKSFPYGGGVEYAWSDEPPTPGARRSAATGSRRDASHRRAGAINGHSGNWRTLSGFAN